ncbi:hypothetical protein MXAN_3179 [Myxococcus xanthus DK 1622]|uniref:Uncharacterized protein n=1 Tax=Myxococcus xanthus (strain DK1622) TaxID=246197 RepID=Q1D7J1_MYXXD|nr:MULTISPECIES: hypothetical protein [Myxococcus]ABF86823.1 hypothetical protein MXAN_3179 [Myxococcus xanthus DK 1622]NOJ55696.1 hypothetical protein [Myxococcus xanthus]QPM82629.1 hypothetical protein I5Q59_15735 [Myxococcus xanthus]QVW64934.1 hypothetical protein JTM82_21080 [Myxococcus xanthus DZ2]UEO01995.1 hypothetical protein K1515_21715 [Myxococcus xanthus DZ2]
MQRSQQQRQGEWRPSGKCVRYRSSEGDAKHEDRAAPVGIEERDEPATELPQQVDEHHHHQGGEQRVVPARHGIEKKARELLEVRPDYTSVNHVAPGIAWVEFPELGQRIAKAAGVPFHGGGPEASATIIRESGKRSIVASLRARGTGKNLTMFSRMLFVNPPADGVAWEQAIGRRHRQGQLADEVEVELYQHTDELVGAFQKARDFARFIEQTEGTPQKQNFATHDCVKHQSASANVPPIYRLRSTLTIAARPSHWSRGRSDNHVLDTRGSIRQIHLKLATIRRLAFNPTTLLNIYHRPIRNNRGGLSPRRLGTSIVGVLRPLSVRLIFSLGICREKENREHCTYYDMHFH